MNATIFVYAKDNIIKCLDLQESLKSGRNLVNDGWTHTHTLDACAFLEYIHNQKTDIVKEIKSLSKTVK